jgi:hypothetical protein
VTDLALLAFAVAGVALWKMRPTIAAAFDAWRISRHPDHIGPMRRADIYERTTR